MAKKCAKCATAVQMIGQMAAMMKAQDAQLERANRIIGWMMPYIGVMAPPDGALGDLNDHCCENHVPNPKREKCDRPIKQGLPL